MVEEVGVGSIIHLVFEVKKEEEEREGGGGERRGGEEEGGRPRERPSVRAGISDCGV